MAVSSLLGVALEVTPLDEKDRDHTPLMRAMRRGRPSIKKQPGGKARLMKTTHRPLPREES
jgi:hypothetical protein